MAGVEGARALAEDAEKMSKDLSLMLKKMEGKMADILQLMEPAEGKEKDVDSESDGFMDVQSDIEKCVGNLMEAMKKLNTQLSDESLQSAGGRSEKRSAEGAGPNVSFGEAVHEAREERIPTQQAQNQQGADVEELRRNLTVVTQREKERVEGLQSQIELVRQELQDSRSQRRLEQASLAASESQASQLRAALTCAEDDLKSLRDALDQELVRSHRLQSQVAQLEEELRIAQEGAGFAQRGEEESRWKQEAVDASSFHSYMAERRREMEGPGRGGGGRAGATRGGRPMSAGRIRPHKGEASLEEQQPPAMREGAAPRREYAQPAPIDVRTNRNASDLHSDTASRSRRPRPTSAPLRSIHSNTKMAATGSPPSNAPFSATRRLDTNSVSFLRSHVISGHVTRNTPLQVAVEYCGKSSFSVRHNEAKYTQLAEQLANVAYEHFKDRRMTVLKNSEVPSDSDVPKPPRLGAFEIELLWTDSNHQPRRTLLHSKLQARVFPNVTRVIEELADVLDPRPKEDEIM